jgi:hypothetical protein
VLHNGSSRSKVMDEIPVTNTHEIPNNTVPKQGKLFAVLSIIVAMCTKMMMKK